MFVGQDELGDLLYSLDSVRERLAQQFFGVERANRIERLIGDRINSKLLVATSTPTAEIEQALAAKRAELQAVAEQIAALDTPGSAERLAGLEEALRLYNAQASFAIKSQEHAANVARLNDQIASKRAEVLALEAPLAGISLESLSARLEAEKKKRADFQNRHSLNVAIERDRAALNAMTPPCTQAFIEGLEAEYEQLSNLRASDAVVPAMQQSLLEDLRAHASTSCPVCHSTVDSKCGIVIQEDVERVRETDAKIHSLPELRSRIQNWRQSLAAHNTSGQMLTERIAHNSVALEAVKDATQDGEVEKWTASLEYMRGEFAKLSGQQSVLQSLEAQFNALPPAPLPPVGVASQTFERFHPAEAQAEVDAIRAGIASLATLRIQEAGHVRDVANLESRISENQGIDARNRQTESMRAKLGKLRQAFHPDGEPKTLVTRRAERMVSKINEYLGILQVPFSVVSVGGFNFEAIFPDKPTSISIRELSGGQKDDLSLAFRFAACESFSATAGLLVLDEPTAALDVQTKHHFANVLERLREMARTLNMQFMVVTHDRQFMGCFDQVIDFTEN